MGHMIVIAGLVSAAVAVLLTPLVSRFAVAIKALDYPGARKVHRRPIPRLGGLAVYLAWVFAIAIAGCLDHQWMIDIWPRLLPVLLAVAASVALGVWDDLQDLSGVTKLMGQMTVAAILVVGDLRIDRISNPFGGVISLPLPLSYLATLAWVVGMMNAINLIDGIDGLAAGVAAIAATGLTIVGIYAQSWTSAVLFAALAGGCAGFLRYNFPPAKIFLGDTGSQLIGLIFAAASLADYQYKTATAAALLVPLTVLMLPIFDTALAILRRLRGRRSIFRADRYHLHHRLLKMGLSQRQVVLFLYLVSLYLSCLAFLFVFIPERYALMLVVLLLLGLTMAMQTMRFLEWTLRQLYRHRRHTRARGNHAA